MNATQAVLLILGALFEFIGIVLVASPDLFPQGIRFSRWLRARARASFDRVRRLFGQRRAQVVKVHAVEEVDMAKRVRAIKSVGTDVPLERRVEFLLTRDQEAQRDVNAIRDRLEDLEVSLAKRLDSARRDIEAGFARELKVALEVYLPLRITGAIALVTGVICMTLASFIRSP